jgi:hypothetical protein
MFMTATSLISTALAAVAYDRDARCLWLEFRHHAVYCYDEVPAAVAEGLLQAASKGSYFHRHIRGRFRYQRIDGQTLLEQSPTLPKHI